jgi:sulfate adenylyltransferase subunit 1 (EFTu-like GTPase family)
MDLVDCREAPFNAIRDEYQVFAAQLAFEDVEAIPIIARDGDNIVRRSERMAWYKGPTCGRRRRARGG